MKYTLSIEQKSPDVTTEVIIGHGILKQSDFKKIAARYAIVTDQTVEKLYKEKLELDAPFIAFPAGEKHKTRATKAWIEDELLKEGIGRDAALIALGGGVVTDVGGFVAATYLRGIPFISIPTTLLGMVDASIGGKTGVNAPQGKNLIGAFYPPRCVLMDLAFLSTLPKQEMKNGMAEVIKYALIDDPAILKCATTSELVQRSVCVKKKIIESDFKESGLRAILNFGHTVGHAIETILDYQIGHGEAISIGMLIESLMSVEMGFLSEADFDRIVSIFKEHDLLLPLSPRITLEKCEEAMRHDKKSEAHVPRFVVLKEIGSVLPFDGKYCTRVDSKRLQEALKRYGSLSS